MAAQERAATSDHATSTPTDHDLIEQHRARASAWCMALAGASLVALIGLGVARLDGIVVTVTANTLSAALTVAVMIAFIEHSTGGALGLLEQRRYRDFQAIREDQRALRREVEIGLGHLAAQVQQLAATVNRLYVAPVAASGQELDEVKAQLADILGKLPTFGDGVVAGMNLVANGGDGVSTEDTAQIMNDKVAPIGRARVLRQHNGSGHTA